MLWFTLMLSLSYTTSILVFRRRGGFGQGVTAPIHVAPGNLEGPKRRHCEVRWPLLEPAAGRQRREEHGALGPHAQAVQLAGLGNGRDGEARVD